MKQAITAITAVLALVAVGETNTTAAAHRHAQVYYVQGHHPFAIQPTIGSDGKATFDHPQIELAKLKLHEIPRQQRAAGQVDGLLRYKAVSSYTDPLRIERSLE